MLWNIIGNPAEFPYAPYGIYFDRADVNAALHAQDSIHWTTCVKEPILTSGKDDTEVQDGLSAGPIQKVLLQVIKVINRVLIGSAQFGKYLGHSSAESNNNMDMAIITNGTLLSIQNMTWNGQLRFQFQPSKES
ncbi:hypothetical protein L204_106355 [Cryptococcus depauperatus]|nr:hypothetical protein L204_06251 [Cryptococcus depauperatus CBS 7855]